MQDLRDHLGNVRRVTQSDMAIDEMLLEILVMLCNIAENGGGWIRHTLGSLQSGAFSLMPETPKIQGVARGV